ncbi:type VI secretion system-associated FHA domain protein [Geoalkalibacter subterraneus]|jgi:hypothetical protein|uniref:Type VI secretion system FHA domain-containing protein n=1 Tax=Geoalkalibacter subterraneus TaxID=483547 RepID=A0A0B5FD96_9BACT|nr:type VI secretion system-associated FHA domain protein [Geoalkalibacter subterraneus]AJF06107.1 hypothetical protein GSUB_05370 [Geoalkalibacter subterraneus]
MAKHKKKPNCSSVGMVRRDEQTTLQANYRPSHRTGTALISGVARLIEGLRCFADEFGLSPRRILGEAWEEFQCGNAEDVLRNWLRDGDDGAQRIERLFNDLTAHQVALLSGVDGVAREAARRFNPQHFKMQTPGLLGIRPRAWRNYCRYYQELTASEQHLHRTLVLPGFVSAYIQTREACCRESSSQLRKPHESARREP